MGKLVPRGSLAYNVRMARNSTPSRAGSVWSVSQLNELARDMLETEFGAVSVEGEISDLLQHRSGHWYFTLKDADAQLRVAMFRYQNRSVRFNPENGQAVQLGGKLSLYPQRGSFQLIASTMVPAGVGKLQRAFEQVKAELQAQGLFATERKRPLPAMPRQVAIVTSPQGAAIRDIVITFKRRYPGARLLVIPAQVQGSEAAASIAAGIRRANELASRPDSARREQHWQPEAIIVGRGGGSLEDLWAFNERVVAEAIANSALPVVSAVGHESDVTIADLVADVRAATPTAAAELLSPDQRALAGQLANATATLHRAIERRLQLERVNLRHLRRGLRHPGETLQQRAQQLDQLDLRAQRAMERRMRSTEARLGQASAKLHLHSPAASIARQMAQFEQLAARLRRVTLELLHQRRQRWLQCTSTLNAVNPLATLDRGYAIIQTDAGAVISGAEEVEIGQQLAGRLSRGQLKLEVTGRELASNSQAGADE